MTAAAERIVVPRGPLRGHAYFVDFAGASHRPPGWLVGALVLAGAIVAVLR